MNIDMMTPEAVDSSRNILATSDGGSLRQLI